jgi:hypothetical protein
MGQTGIRYRGNIYILARSKTGNATALARIFGFNQHQPGIKAEIDIQIY